MKYRYKHHPSRMITLMATFGGGGRAGYKKYPNGIAHLAEHAHFLGTGNYTSKDLSWKLAAEGGSWNAWTSEDLVNYHISLPEDNIEAAFDCLNEIINNPTFPEDKFDKEKEVVCQEVRMYQDDISSLVYYKLMESVFNGAPATPIVGTEETVRATTRDDLLAFRNEFYGKHQRLITLCGPNDHKDLVEKYFGPIDNELQWKPADAPEYKPSSEQAVIKEAQLQHVINVAFAGHKIDAISSPRNDAKLTVFNSIFGGSDVSRLFLTVREDMGLVYGIHSGLHNGMDGSVFVIGTETEPENSDKVVSEINNQVQKMTDTLPTNEELRGAKNKIRSSQYRAMDASAASASRILNEEFYAQQPYEQFMEDLNDVTAEDVREMAQVVFGENKHKVIGHG